MIDIVPFSLIVTFVIAGGFMIVAYLYWRDEEGYKKKAQQTREQLEQRGFTVLESIIQSPSVFVKVSSYDGFVDIAKRLGRSEVFFDFPDFYVFSRDWQIAYRFRVG